MLRDGRRAVARKGRDAVKTWLTEESDRVAGMIGAAVPPEHASPEIIAAPARGTQMVVPQYETVQTPSGPRTRRATQEGFHPVRAADAFDVMMLNHRRTAKDAPPLFTVGQVEAGRAYAVLAEKVASEGMKGATLEPPTGAGGARDWMDGVIMRSARLGRMQDAIGGDVMVGFAKGRDVAVRSVVDAVCLHGMTVTQLMRHMHIAVTPDRRAMLMKQLVAALDRLRDKV